MKIFKSHSTDQHDISIVSLKVNMNDGHRCAWKRSSGYCLSHRLSDAYLPKNKYLLFPKPLIHTDICTAVCKENIASSTLSLQRTKKLFRRLNEQSEAKYWMIHSLWGSGCFQMQTARSRSSISISAASDSFLSIVASSINFQNLLWCIEREESMDKTKQ